MTDPMAILASILNAILTPTIVAALVVAFFERRNKRAAAAKLEADYAEQISKTAMMLVDPLQGQVTQLTRRVARTERQITRYSQRIVYLMGGIDQLIRQIMVLDKRPVWTPDDWNPEEVEDG